MDYRQFLESKKTVVKSSGFEVDKTKLNSKLFEWQKDIVYWALKKGKAALFEDCGLGKTPQQLEWANQVHQYTGGNILILAPLAVSKQTKREGEKFGIETHICRTQADVKPGINITNYEMLEHFNPDKFIGVVLDESSILKSYMGKTKQQIIRSFKNTPYKLACTATPSPNDHMEILNHSAFLDVMESHEALAIWFINDTMNMGKYRLKNYAVKPFWEWVSTWAVSLSKPSDIGYPDDGFILPKLNVIEEIIPVNEIEFNFDIGCFLRDISLNATSLHAEKRKTAEDRAKRTMEIAGSIDDQVLVWCDTNYEADLLKKYIPKAIEIRGSDSPNKKEKAAIDFVDGNIQVLISKPSIFGFGLNFQNCNNTIFCGLSYSYESYYQAIRRLWRFGQTKEVNAHIVLGNTEKTILDTVRHKEAEHEEMKRNMYGSIKEIQNANIKGIKYKIDYDRNERIYLPNWLKEAN